MNASKIYKYQHILVSLLGILLLVATQNALAEEQCLKDTWREYNSANYLNAIKFADQCIDEFGTAADLEQDKLIRENEPLPPNGKVNDFDKNRIFQRGLLNDVATSYFIKGKSAELQYRKGGPKADSYKEMATKTYQACRYKHARTWDPNGWFWPTCDTALGRLPIK
jgi:hypothetical protein